MDNKDVQQAEKLLDRREFMGLATALAAIGASTMLPAATAMAANGPSTEFTRWLESIGGNHRIVLDMREPNGGMALAWAWVYLLTAQQGYGVPESDLGVALVLRHNAIPLALGDVAWKKYPLGEYFSITDPDTGKAALRNPFATNNTAYGFLPEMALHPLMQRGVRVGACDMAIQFYSGEIAKQVGGVHEEVKADWNRALLPGIAHMPSGLVACEGAVSRGCTYLYAG